MLSYCHGIHRGVDQQRPLLSMIVGRCRRELLQRCVMANEKRFSTLVIRALRLRCPVCGQGRLFRGWFKMHDVCPECDATFEREAGFYLGSIYVNYGLTALVVAIGYPVLLFNQIVAEGPLLAMALGFSIIFPICFFRYARSLWLGFDEFCDPRRTADPSSDAE